MKTLLISVLSLVTMMTACHATDEVTPRPATTVQPVTSTLPADSTHYRDTAHSTGQAATVTQSGEAGTTAQPAGRREVADSQPTVSVGVGPVSSVTPVDTLAHLANNQY